LDDENLNPKERSEAMENEQKEERIPQQERKKKEGKQRYVSNARLWQTEDTT